MRTAKIAVIILVLLIIAGCARPVNLAREYGLARTAQVVIVPHPRPSVGQPMGFEPVVITDPEFIRSLVAALNLRLPLARRAITGLGPFQLSFLAESGSTLLTLNLALGQYQGVDRFIKVIGRYQIPVIPGEMAVALNQAMQKVFRANHRYPHWMTASTLVFWSETPGGWALRQYDLTTGRISSHETVNRHPDLVSCLAQEHLPPPAWSDADKFLIAPPGVDYWVLVDLLHQQIRRVAIPEPSLLVAGALDPRANRLLYRTTGTDGEIKLTDLSLGRPVSVQPIGSRQLAAAAWAPDGRWVAYVLRSENPDPLGPPTVSYALMLVGASGQNAHQLLAAELITGLRWSPDGRQLLFGYRPKGVAPGIAPTVVLYDLSTRALVAPVDRANAAEGLARISPNGRWLAFVSGQPGQELLFLAETNGDNLHWVAGRGPVTDLSWSPDSRYLAFIDQVEDTAKLFIYEVSTGKVIRIGG